MRLTRTLTLALLLAAAAGSARAGTLSDLGLSREQVRALNGQLTAPVVAPGIAFGSPTGFGAGWGQAFAGIGGQTIEPAAGQDLDGSGLLGFGLGDQQRFIALETAMNIISLQDSLGDSGNWNFKLHHTFPSRGAVAIGIEDTGGWGDAQDRSSSTYAVYTKVVELSPTSPKLPLSLTFNVGLGNERFAEPDQDLGAFGSVALAWHRQGSFIADWTGRDLNFGVSVVPFYRVPLVFSAGFINLTERFADIESAAGVGYLYQF